MKQSYPKPLRLASVAILVSVMLAAGCANTVRGVGKDIRDTANAVEDSLD